VGYNEPERTILTVGQFKRAVLSLLKLPLMCAEYDMNDSAQTLLQPCVGNAGRSLWDHAQSNTINIVAYLTQPTQAHV
jgi:hypothetical protein